MLSAHAHTFRHKTRLAISLSWIGGYTNVISLTVCGWAASHMSGMTTMFGRSIASHGGAPAVTDLSGGGTVIFLGYLLGCFLCGALVSGLLTEMAGWRGWRSRHTTPISLEVLLLAVFSLCLDYHLRHPQTLHLLYAMNGIAALAMGLQNATITHISGSVVRTTHVTGVVTDIGLELAQIFHWLAARGRWSSLRRHRRLLKISLHYPPAQRLALLASIYGSFLFGVTSGALLLHYQPFIVMLPPVLFLVFVLVMTWARPVSDVKGLDLINDPELKMHGLSPELLPPALGIYRLARNEPGRCGAPNFERWAQTLPSAWRVVILALSPVMRLDHESVQDLDAALQNLRRRGCELILCGLAPSHLKLLSRLGVRDRLGVQNIAPDLEFAVARGIALLTPLD